MLRNLGAPIHASDFPEIVVNNYDGEHSEFGIIEIRQTSRHSETWGHSETEGTCRNRSYALAHAHFPKFQNLEFEK